MKIIALNQYSVTSAKKNLLTAFFSRILSFRNMFFPYCINVWRKLNDNFRNANSIHKFKNYLKVQKYMITLTQIMNIEVFTFIAVMNTFITY